MSGSFAGTGVLLRLALRRDRVTLPLWVVLVLLVVFSAAGVVLARRRGR